MLCYIPVTLTFFILILLRTANYAHVIFQKHPDIITRKAHPLRVSFVAITVFAIKM